MRILWLLLVLFSFRSIAQVFDYPSRETGKLRSRMYVIILQEETDSFAIRSNNIIKEAFRNNKNLKNIQPGMLREKDLLAMNHEDASRFITIEFASLRKEKNTKLHQEAGKRADLDKYLLKEGEFGYFEVNFGERFKKPGIWKLYTPTSNPNELNHLTSLLLIFNFLKEKKDNSEFSDFEYEKRIKTINDQLRNKTLLIDSAFADKVGKSYNYINEEYPEKVLVTDQITVSKNLKAQSDTCAYVYIIPYKDEVNRGGSYEGTAGGGMSSYEQEFYFMHYVISSSTGEILSFVKSDNKFIIRKTVKLYLRFAE